MRFVVGTWELLLLFLIRAFIYIYIYIVRLIKGDIWVGLAWSVVVGLTVRGG